MGRPINKRYLGEVLPGTDDGKFPAVVKIGANAVTTTGYIISQRSSTVYVASDGAGNQGSCRLVNKAVPGDDEMVVQGFVAGSGDPVSIRKLQNRTVIDYDNNRYDWEIQDDSTANILVLTKL
jgi:hypothetical protein